MKMAALFTTPLLVVALASPVLGQRATNTRAETTPSFHTFEAECRTTAKMSDDCTGLLLNGGEYTGLKYEAARCSMPHFWAGYDASPNKQAIGDGNWDVGIAALISAGACNS